MSLQRPENGAGWGMVQCWSISRHTRIEDGTTGWLFAPRSVRDAARALDRALSSDSDTRASVGRAGREVVRRRHDARGYSTEIVALLRRMIASPGVSAEQHLKALRSQGKDVRSSHAIGERAQVPALDQDEQQAALRDLR